MNYLELVDTFVTAERIPSNRWDTPANVTVITAQEIEDNHYQTVAEALSHVNGVYATALGRMDTSGYVNVIGTGRVLLLIDGHRANIAQGHNAGANGEISELSMIPSVKIVDRIEIIKGTASALYGSDAVDGVVNIITKRGTRNETEIDVNYGSWNRQKYELTNQGINGNFSWFVTTGFGKSDVSKYPSNGYTNSDYVNNDYKDIDVSIRVDYKFNDRDSLTLSYMHRSHDFGDDYVIYGNVTDTLNLSYGYFKAYNLYNNASIEYRFKENTSTPGWIRYFNNYQTGYNRDTHYAFISNSKLQGLEYQNGWEFGRHKLIVGAEWHRSDAKCEGYGYNTNLISVASYLQDTISIGNKWTLIPSVRYDHDRNYSGNWSPKIAANYRADEKTKLYAQWGRNYRSPTIGELYTNYSSDYGAFLYIGGAYSELVGEYGFSVPKLHPEKGQGKTFGIEHDFNDRSSLALTIFHNQVDGGIDWDYISADSFPWFFFKRNKQKLENRGFEITYRQKLNDHWSYDFGYSQAHVEDDYFISNSNEVNVLYTGQPKGYRAGLHYLSKSWRAQIS